MTDTKKARVRVRGQKKNVTLQRDTIMNSKEMRIIKKALLVMAAVMAVHSAASAADDFARRIAVPADNIRVTRRPAEGERLFRSYIIEQKIAEVKLQLSQAPYLAWMFENCFPNTLDTTVHYSVTDDGDDDTYVFTGDIHAMWLRDSGAQVWPYVQFAREDEELRRMIRGTILRHNSANVGDEVSWGRFETDAERPGKETLTWIVVKREGDNVCLLTKQGIDGYWYNQNHEAVSWENSDIRELINSKEYVEKMFNKYELASVVVKNDDILSLLTVDEALEYFDSDEERELSITPIAQMEGTNVNTLSKVNKWDMKGYRSSWWWLRSTKSDIYAPVVTVDGVVLEGEKEVNRTGGAIRPVIWVNCSKNDNAK